ncbi:REP-associated tyrosine transposase [Lederbergia citrea]|uniref:REP-associated tyrosine transposase n=1 Tax=Lederbergia citrea TaxID=2833581 RepID=UPI0020163D8B|nr:transposase [Lederbergia citrea]
MGRKRRLWIPHLFYHIGCRGNRRDPLFRSSSDFDAFFYILEQLHDEIPFEIASYCLMTNHFHLQLRSKEESISKVMSLINKRYANYYNTRYNLTGHVFEKRFYDEIIRDRAGMIQVSQYIHFNPVEAMMVGRPEKYKWSSYHHYLTAGKASLPKFMNIHSILDCFDGTIAEKRAMYDQACYELREIQLNRKAKASLIKKSAILIQ